MLANVSDYSLRVTQNKRQRGILRKAMELSTICDLEIHIVIFDAAKNKKVEYKSSSDFEVDAIAPTVELEYYDNSDYDELMNKFTKKEQLKKIQEKHAKNRQAAQAEPTAEKILQNVLKKRQVKTIEKKQKTGTNKNELFKIQRVEKQDEIIGSSELKDELSLNNPE